MSELEWVKATASHQGGCVELAAITPEWVKAEASNPSGNCVQMAAVPLGVAVRDSKDPDGPVLKFSREEIAAFLNGAKRGEFDFLLSDSGR